MLNRRHLRIRVLQFVYSWNNSNDINIKSLEKEFLKSLNKIEELYLMLLLYVLELRNFAEDFAFDSKNKKNLEESRNMLSFVQSNILILLHPFIPFFTEKVWQDFKFSNYFKRPLMFKNWDIKPQNSFNKSFKKIDWLIGLVTSIRSTKVDLNVSPGAFIDISTFEISANKISIINKRIKIIKN